MKDQETHKDQHDNPEAATIYFFRPRKLAGSIPEIVIATAKPDELIVKIANGYWFKREYVHFGKRSFVTGVYSINPEPFVYEIEPGKCYYIRCMLHLRGLKIMSRLELVDESIARREMARLQQQFKIK